MLNKKILRTNKIVLMISLCLICWAGVGLAVDDIHNGVGNMTGLSGNCSICDRTGPPHCPGDQEDTCTFTLGLCGGKHCGYECSTTTGVACRFTSNPDALCTPGTTSCGGNFSLQCAGLGICFCGMDPIIVDCGDRAQCTQG